MIVYLLCYSLAVLLLQVVRMGSVVEVKDFAGERRKTVVMKYYSETGAVLVVDVKSRKKKTVCD